MYAAAHGFNNKKLVERFSVTYKRDEVIFWEGDAANYFYVVLEGSVEIVRRRADGTSMHLGLCKAGDFFGEMALLNAQPRTGTAVAAERNTRLLAMSQDQLLQLLADNSSFALKMIKVLCARLKNLGDHLVQV